MIFQRRKRPQSPAPLTWERHVDTGGYISYHTPIPGTLSSAGATWVMAQGRSSTPVWCRSCDTHGPPSKKRRTTGEPGWAAYIDGLHRHPWAMSYLPQQGACSREHAELAAHTLPRSWAELGDYFLATATLIEMPDVIPEHSTPERLLGGYATALEGLSSGFIKSALDILEAGYVADPGGLIAIVNAVACGAPDEAHSQDALNVTVAMIKAGYAGSPGELIAAVKTALDIT